MLSILFPGKDQPDPPINKVAVIKVPLRIGVAFVPDNGSPEFRLSEANRLALAARVRDSFANYPFVSGIGAVPSLYLESGGGFANLDRLASLLRLDVVALISYDQVQHAGANKKSFLYWTGLGAYLIEGDQFDVLTALETTVCGVRSHRLLMHASGTSSRKGGATWVNFAERAREARTASFSQAVGKMIENLYREVKGLRERAPHDPMFRLVLPAGYRPDAAPAAPAPAAGRYRGTNVAPVNCSCASTSPDRYLRPWPSALASASDWCTASPTTVGTFTLSARWV